eukprot:SAG22_NODE_21362_length_257_cov_1.310127_1_plen_32_part_10
MLQDARSFVKAICSMQRHPAAPSWPRLAQMPL